MYDIKVYELRNRYLEIPNLFSGLESQDGQHHQHLKMILVAQNIPKYAVNMSMKMTLIYFDKKRRTLKSGVVIEL